MDLIIFICSFKIFPVLINLNFLFLFSFTINFNSFSSTVITFFAKVSFRTFIFKPASLNSQFKKTNKKNLYGNGEKKYYLTAIKFKWNRKHTHNIVGIHYKYKADEARLNGNILIFTRPHLCTNQNVGSNLFLCVCLLRVGKDGK